MDEKTQKKRDAAIIDIQHVVQLGINDLFNRHRENANELDISLNVVAFNVGRAVVSGFFEEIKDEGQKPSLTKEQEDILRELMNNFQTGVEERLAALKGNSALPFTTGTVFVQSKSKIVQ